jgi:hypothetical protein
MNGDISDDEIRNLLRTAARSIMGVDRGEYCQCDDPESLGMVCGKCERRIKSEEVRKVVEIVGCHEHVPGQLNGYMCKVCTMWPDSPRHLGVAAIGRTSWGGFVHPLRVDAPNNDVTCWVAS